MSLSVQRSVVEQFSFNGKNVQSVHVKVEECLVSRDVYKAIGYEEENGKKAIQNLVPSKYKLRFGHINPSPCQGENIFPLHKDMVLLKEPGLYCFLLRCKRDEGEPFMEWAMETVLPREVRKLASVIEEKDNQIQNLEHTNEKHQQKTLKLNEEIEKNKKYLKLRYPDMEKAGRCDDPNAIHRSNIFKSEVIEKPNYYKNHFSLTEENRELLEAVLDVTI